MMDKQIRKLISEFLVHLGLDFTDVEVEMLRENEYHCNVVSESPNLMIGRHGDHLKALQKVITVVLHKQFGEELQVHIDVDNYRKRQEENVLIITKQKIEEVRQSGVQSALPPMSPYFRRVVHMFVRDGEFTDIATESMGQGNYRQVVIKPAA